MNLSSLLICPFFSRHASKWFVGLCLATLLVTAVAHGQIEGVTEPFRSIELASDESGSIGHLAVEEGDYVDRNAVVCQLDSSVQEIQVEIAKHLAESKSQVWAAEQTFDKRTAITERIRTLLNEGHATDSELIRSEMELSIAKARFLSSQEDAKVREIEYRRALLQLQRRTIRAPFAGVVSKIHRREGEFLSPLHPEILTLIQVDRLIAKFNIPSSQVRGFAPGKKFELELLNGQTVTARVYTVGVRTEAESGTVEIKMIIENPDQEFRAGEFLTLNI